MSPVDHPHRRLNNEPVSWFIDLHSRELLDLDPPYQRRSVWSQKYKDAFVDTILLGYPAPAIFLYSEILEDGRTIYHVVDGKQRLTTVLAFVSSAFPVAENSEVHRLRGKYFREFDTDARKAVWAYLFPVEYLGTDDEGIINRIFDRINRNVAKLTPQELRHARYEGEFIRAAEDLAESLPTEFPKAMPNITPQARKQMKDVEQIAQLLLLIELGPRGYSTDQLDEAFSERDDDWPSKATTIDHFRRTVGAIQQLFDTDTTSVLFRSRYRNQADFYSLFGGISAALRDTRTPPIQDWITRLTPFLHIVDDPARRATLRDAVRYYDAARSASNDAGPRQLRIEVLSRVLAGQMDADLGL